MERQWIKQRKETQIPNLSVDMYDFINATLFLQMYNSAENICNRVAKLLCKKGPFFHQRFLYYPSSNVYFQPGIIINPDFNWWLMEISYLDVCASKQLYYCYSQIIRLACFLKAAQVPFYADRCGLIFSSKVHCTAEVTI